MSYAINISDLVTLPEPESTIVIDMLVAPVIQSRDTVAVYPQRINGMAVILECGDERAQAIVDVIRLKIPEWQLHCYRKAKRRGWKSI